MTGIELGLKERSDLHSAAGPWYCDPTRRPAKANRFVGASEPEAPEVGSPGPEGYLHLQTDVRAIEHVP